MSKEPKRGDTVWVSDRSDPTNGREYVGDLGLDYRRRYVTICQGVLAAWCKMTTEDPNKPKERTPHWVHVRNYGELPWDRRIFVMDRADGINTYLYRYRCVEGVHADEYIAGRDYATSDWRYMEEIPKRVPWTAEDYAKRQIVWLKSKSGTGFWRIQHIYSHRHDMEITKQIKSYTRIAEQYTLPDGTELYKDGVG